MEYFVNASQDNFGSLLLQSVDEIAILLVYRTWQDSKKDFVVGLYKPINIPSRYSLISQASIESYQYLCKPHQAFPIYTYTWSSIDESIADFELYIMRPAAVLLVATAMAASIPPPVAQDQRASTLPFLREDKPMWPISNAMNIADGEFEFSVLLIVWFLVAKDEVALDDLGSARLEGQCEPLWIAQSAICYLCSFAYYDRCWYLTMMIDYYTPVKKTRATDKISKRGAFGDAVSEIADGAWHFIGDVALSFDQ